MVKRINCFIIDSPPLSVIQQDGHDESKCFNNMESLEAVMKKHNISIDSTFSSSSHRHALSSSAFSFNAISTSSYDE